MEQFIYDFFYGLNILSITLPISFLTLFQIVLIICIKGFIKDKMFKQWLIAFIITTLLNVALIGKAIELSGGFHIYYKGEQILDVRK